MCTGCFDSSSTFDGIDIVSSRNLYFNSCTTQTDVNLFFKLKLNGFVTPAFHIVYLNFVNVTNVVVVFSLIFVLLRFICVTVQH